jgi:hypothetical protein
MTPEKQPVDPRTAETLWRRAWVLSVIGGLLTAVGLIWLGLRLSFVLNGESATGGIERVEQRIGGLMWQARFSYGDREGRRHTAETLFVSKSLCPSITVGNSVAVRYSADAPERAMIVSVGTLWFGPGAVLALGLLFVAGGRLFRLFARKAAAKAAKQGRA